MRLSAPWTPNHPEYADRVARYHVHVERLHDALAQVEAGGPPHAHARLAASGRLGARERLARLLDPGTPFCELSPLAAWEVYPEWVPAAGIITGIGRIAGKPCMVFVHDPTVKGGAYFPLTVKKHLRAQEIAATHRLPCVYIVDSAGAYLPYQADLFADSQHFGRIFYNQVRMSAAGIAQVAVVMGSCTAGGAYIPAMADESIMVDGAASIFLGGPPLVQAATGEVVDAETLGGARVHCTLSGVADHLARDPYEALGMVRQIIAQVPGPVVCPVVSYTDPLYDPEGILACIPADPKMPMPIAPILAHLVDGSEWDPFKPDYGTSLHCGFAAIQGMPVGIVANEGVLFSESACKGAHFIQLCEKRQIPLLFLQNITGFMVGKAYEHEGITKHGAKMVHAVAGATVPKYTVIIGNSFGAGNYGMCGRAYDPRFLWIWPHARIGVMGGSQAGAVLAAVRHAPGPEEAAHWEHQYEQTTSAWYSTARLWDDGIIDPRKTRAILGLALALSRSGYPAGTDPTMPLRSHFGVWRM